MEPHEVLSEDHIPYQRILSGLARQCPKCKCIAHYKVKGKKPVEINCVECDFKFTVQKYKKGERPKAPNNQINTESTKST